MMNVFCFSGNVGKDGDIRYTPNGDAVLNFSVAVTSGYGDKKKTTWVNCQRWGKAAEGLAPYIKKGVDVSVSGELSQREYEKDGVKHTSLDVRVSEITLHGARNAEQSQGDTKAPAAKENAPKSNFDDFDDNIPF